MKSRKKIKKSRKLRKKGEPEARKKVIFARVPIELANRLKDYCYRNNVSINKSIVLAIKRLVGVDGES
jgi:hypothetical protein